MRTRKYKADLEEVAEGYQDARDYEFNQQFRDTLFIQGVNTNLEHWEVTEEDIQGFMDSFTFPDEDEWCDNELQSRMESFEDAKYEEMRDERRGL